MKIQERKPGDKRIVTRFLFLPLTVPPYHRDGIKRETRVWEFVQIEQEYYCYTGGGSWGGGEGWTNVRFVDESGKQVTNDGFFTEERIKFLSAFIVAIIISTLLFLPFLCSIPFAILEYIQ